MKKNKLVALFAGLSLAFVSSAALAAPSADTLLVAGYDSDQMAVLYGVSDIDQDDAETVTLDCTLVGDFVYELDTEAAEDATEVAVTGLKKKGGDGEEDKDVEFFFEDDEDRVEGSGVLYGAESGDDVDGAEECGLTSVTIEPNGEGEVNHGTVVSTFSKLFDGGNGCLIRHFAQSDFGKGDYDEMDVESFEVTLDSYATACGKDKKSVEDDSSSEKGKDNAPGQTRERPDKGGKDNAPGQSKVKGDD